MQTKTYSLVLFFLFVFNSYSQINFEKGYFIDNAGKKTDCLIKNIDWKDNPTEFEYKLTDNSKVENNSIVNVQEFGISNSSKYKRVTVNIDRSRVGIENLTYEKNPVFKEETLFLKGLIEGKANLFLYSDGELKRYFFNVDNSNIEQLIFKSYLVDGEEGVGFKYNNQYKQQIYLHLKCDGLSLENIESLVYEKEKLVKCFLKYNNCFNSVTVNYEDGTKRKAFNLSISSGISESSFSFYNSTNKYLQADFGNKTTLRLGAEFEYIFPFNKNKWTIIVEPAYRYFKAEQSGNIYDAKVDYKAIDVSFGIRHYMFLNNKSKLFISSAFVKSINLNSKIKFKGNTGNSNFSLDIRPLDTVVFGFGYKYNNKFSIELRYALEQNLLRNYFNWHSSFNSSSLIFGYTLF